MKNLSFSRAQFAYCAACCLYIGFGVPESALAAPYWNIGAGTIENPISNVVGSVQNNHAYSLTTPDQPLSASGVSEVQGSDGKVYQVKVDGTLVAESDDQSSDSSGTAQSGSSADQGSAGGADQGSTSNSSGSSSSSSSASSESQTGDGTLSQFKTDYYDPNMTVGAATAWEYIPQTGGTALAGDPGSVTGPGQALAREAESRAALKAVVQPTQSSEVSKSVVSKPLSKQIPKTRKPAELEKF